MKVKVISRNPDDYLRETKKDIHKMPRNYDPSLHPFEAQREYVQALNATKLERVFAKPFLGCLDGHRDGVCCFSKHPQSLSCLVSGGYDGQICVWDLPSRTNMRNFYGHEGFVHGIVYMPNGESFISVGNDKSVKFWKGATPEFGEEEEPFHTILSRTVLMGISHHRSQPQFATCGEVCQIWDETRNEPLKTLKWGVDSLHTVAFNAVETSLLAACASDRSIILYDQREAKPLRKVIMTMRPNKLAWNPMEAFTFSVANEDYNLYTFDTRRLKNPVKIHKGHVSAVMDVDYSPTGQEIVSGSYDKTIRIFSVFKNYSRDVYHTKRMQHITCIGWSLDSKYIFSGSDEMNIRLWKARASEKLGAMRPREKMAFRQNETLKEKFSAHPQVRRIAQHRHVPSKIYKDQKKLSAIREKEVKKELNRRKHSKAKKHNDIPEKKKVIISESK
ncbi:DDB1- and CUL4-associated factor 13 [Phlebotomus argentipes]|uniref:DDB1- and CUL4-associated factor 13 n=1 Tax=Phlebotomus argentipes TaxID=94469 RepID=UPI002892D05A|nr:DDB1- and CUL4-associated factor 13 [Phlebotomus argentipes]